MVTEPETDRNAGDDALLADFFAAGRAVPAVPPDLAARILADARAELEHSRAGAVAATGPAQAPARGFLSSLLSAIGGWPAISGMAAATAAGVWLGFASPALIEGTGFYGSTYSLSDLMPSAVLAVADTSGE